MRTYLFGISAFCRRLIADGEISVSEVTGLFDNDLNKIGKMSWGLLIEKPKYVEEAKVIITLTDHLYWLEALRQLIGLGYMECTIIHERENGYERKCFDFRRYFSGKSNDRLIVLYLQHRSYSGICAIAYMVKSGKVSLPAGFRIAIMTSEEDESGFYYYTAMADYFITERDSLKVYGKKIQLWHGFPLKALGHMMKNYMPKGFITSNQWAGYEHIVSYGQIYTTFMCACYGTPGSQYWTIGMPRNDLLYCVDGKKLLHEMMPDSIGRRVVLYMPTFRQMERKTDAHMQMDGREDGYIFYWEDFTINRLESFCQSNNLYFIFKLHPSDASKAKNWYVQSHYIGIMTDGMLGENCMYEYLNATDILITDYSSVYFDYLLLDRPIIFTDKDVDFYMERRGLILEPLEFWRPGAAVHTMDSLECEIVNGLNGKDLYQEKRQCLLSVVHHYQDGHATRRLFDAIAEEARSVQRDESSDGSV